MLRYVQEPVTNFFCFGASVQRVYQSLFTENSCLLLQLETTLTRAVRENQNSKSRETTSISWEALKSSTGLRGSAESGNNSQWVHRYEQPLSHYAWLFDVSFIKKKMLVQLQCERIQYRSVNNLLPWYCNINIDQALALSLGVVSCLRKAMTNGHVRDTYYRSEWQNVITLTDSWSQYSYLFHEWKEL